ncbi:phage portal protein, partial [Escherichia coli]
LRAWNPPSESVDAALLPNFTRGNARADDLVRNNGYAANAIQLPLYARIMGYYVLIFRTKSRNKF